MTPEASMQALQRKGNRKSAQRIFLEEGLLVLPQVFHGADLDRLRRAAEHARDAYFRRLDQAHSGHRNSNMFFQVHNPELHTDTREHLMAILEGAADPRCLAPVEQVFEGPALFRCTTLFFNPRFESSEGRWHRDMQFLLETEDELREWIEANRRGDTAHPIDGIQFQVALVDNDDVEYVPFSPTRYDSPDEFRIRASDGGAHAIDSNMPDAVRVALKAGDAMMFNPNGMHRGRYHRDIARLTLMFTYTPLVKPRADDFSYQPWFLDGGYSVGLSDRARLFYEQFVDQYRELLQEQRSPLTFPGD
jgi:ectoine hydroxylase-related dioxygenase (phytanoyl-CoA dioxygenase family)